MERGDNLDQLYKVVNDRELFTGSIEDFRKKYENDSDQQQVLFNVVKDRQLFTKGFEDFNNKYFPKPISSKNETPSNVISENTNIPFLPPAVKKKENSTSTSSGLSSDSSTRNQVGTLEQQQNGGNEFALFQLEDGISPAIENTNFDASQPESELNKKFFLNPDFKTENRNIEIFENPDFDPNLAESSLNTRFFSKNSRVIKKKNPLDSASDFDIEKLNEFKNIKNLTEEDLKEIDEKISKESKGNFGFFGNTFNKIVNSPTIGFAINPFFNPDNQLKVSKREELINERIQSKRSKFIDDLDDSQKDKIQEIISFEQFNLDESRKLKESEIKDIDSNLSLARDTVLSITERFNSLNDRKRQIQDQLTSSEVDNLPELRSEFQAISQEQSEIESQRNEIIKETQPIINNRIQKLNELEDNLNNLGTQDQEIDLLKRQYGFLDNIIGRAGIGFANLGANVKFQAQRINLIDERMRLKEVLKTGENPFNIEIPASSKVSEFNEEEFDEQTENLKEKLLSSVITDKSILQTERDKLRKNISVSEINSVEDVFDFTIDGLADNTATVAQLAIPYVGQASFVVAQQADSEISIRERKKSDTNRINEINNSLNEDGLSSEEKESLESEKSVLERATDNSESDIFIASSTLAVSELVFSKLFGEAKRLNIGKRVLSNATKQQLRSQVKRNISNRIKEFSKQSFGVIKDGAEEGLLDEFLTNATQNSINKFYLGDDRIGVFDNSIDAIAGGFSVGSALSVSPRITGQFISHISNQKKRENVFNNVSEIADLQRLLDETNDLDQNTIDITKNRINELFSENKKIISTTVDNFDNLDLDEKKELLDISSKKASIEISLDRLNQKSKLNSAEKSLKSEIEKNLVDLNNQQDSIINRKITISVNGKETESTKNDFENFISDDANISKIISGDIDVKIDNDNKSAEALSNRIEEIKKENNSTPKEVLEFAESLGKTEDISDIASGSTKVSIGNSDVILKKGEGSIKIDSISTQEDSRNQGSAKNALQKITELADSNGSKLELDVVPLEESVDKERLKKLYLDEGFVEDSNNPDKLFRDPITENTQQQEDSFNQIDSILENSNPSEIDVSTNINDYKVSINEGKLNIEPKFGNKKPSQRERKIIVDQFINDFDFDNGTQVEIPNDSSITTDQITSEILEKSTNPIEVARQIKSQQEFDSLVSDSKNNSLEGAIASALQGVKVNKESFSQVDDINNVPDINQFYFSSKNKNKSGKSGNIDSIREVAQSLTENTVELSDITDFIKSNSNPNSFLDSQNNNVKDLKNKFKSLTGITATDSNIENVLKNESPSDSQEQQSDSSDQDIPFQVSSTQERIKGSELNGLIDRLKKTGLSSDVKVLSSPQIIEELKSLGFNIDSENDAPNGFVNDNVVFLNRDQVKKDTPIHEFGHLWVSHIKSTNRQAYNTGLNLVKGSEYESQVINNETYSELSENQILEEALSQAIGEKGVKILNESKKKQFSSWFKNLFTKIAKGLRIRNLSEDKLSDLTLDKFTDLASAELLSAQKIANRSNAEQSNKVDESDVNAIDLVISQQKSIKETKDKIYQKFNDQKSTISDIKKDLVGFIKSSIDSSQVSELQKNELVKLLRGVEKSKTKNNLLKEFDKVNNIITSISNRVILRKINGILNKRFSKRESGRRKANITNEETANILSEIKNNTLIKGNSTTKKSDLINDKIVELFDARELLLDKDSLTDSEQIDLQTIGISLEILSANTSNDVDNANDLLSNALSQIEEIFNDGRSSLKELRNLQKEEINQTISDLESDANPENLTSNRTVSDIKKELQLESNPLTGAFKKIYFDLFRGKVTGSLDSISAFISKKGGENRDSSSWVQFVNKLKNRERVKRQRIRSFSKKISDAQKNIFGSTRKADALLNKIVKLQIEVLPDDSSVKVKQDANYSISQLINVWQNYHNKDLRAGLASNGFTDSVLQDIEKILPESAKDYGNFIFSVYQDLYNQSNEIYKKLNFHSLGKPDFYAGKVNRESTEVSQKENDLLGASRIRTTGYGSQKERVLNDKKINAIPVDTLLKRNIEESSHYIAFAEVHKEYNAIIKDKSIQKALLLNNGLQGSQIIDSLIYYKTKDVEQGGERGNKIVDTLGRNIAKSVLALKTKIGITQTISIINGSFDLPNNMSTREFLDAYSSIVQDGKFLFENSDFLKIRYDSENIENAILGLESISDDKSIRFKNSQVEANRRAIARSYKRILDLSLVNVKFGDTIGVMGAIPVFTSWKARFIKRGFSEDVATQKALEKFESSADRSQQSISAFGKSEIQKSPYLRYIMMFATSPIQNFQNANFHRRELIKGLRGQESKGSNVRNAFAFLNYQFAQPMLYTYISNILSGGLISAFKGLLDEEDSSESDKALLSSAILGNVQSVPIIGGILLYTIDKIVLDKEFTFGGLVSSPLFEEIKKIEANIKNASEAKNEKSRERHIFNAIKKTSGLLAGIPNFSFDVLNEWNDVYWNDNISTESKVYRALGYSKPIISEKTGEELSKRSKSKKSRSERRKDSERKRKENQEKRNNR